MSDVSILAVGDELQSAGSRLGAYMRDLRLDLPYEESMALLELEGAVHDWTKLRSKMEPQEPEDHTISVPGPSHGIVHPNAEKPLTGEGVPGVPRPLVVSEGRPADGVQYVDDTPDTLNAIKQFCRPVKAFRTSDGICIARTQGDVWIHKGEWVSRAPFTPASPARVVDGSATLRPTGAVAHGAFPYDWEADAPAREDLVRSQMRELSAMIEEIQALPPVLPLIPFEAFK